MVYGLLIERLADDYDQESEPFILFITIIGLVLAWMGKVNCRSPHYINEESI
jgi:hypothetical protein